MLFSTRFVMVTLGLAAITVLGCNGQVVDSTDPAGTGGTGGVDASSSGAGGGGPDAGGAASSTETTDPTTTTTTSAPEEPACPDDCDDGNACTQDFCVEGACQHGDLTYAKPCTTVEEEAGYCAGQQCLGGCDAKPDGAPCSKPPSAAPGTCVAGVCN